MTLALTVIIVMLFSAASLAWIGMNLPLLVGFTTELLQWCQSLVSACLTYTTVFTAVLLWAGAVAVMGGIAYALIKGAAGLLRSHAAIRRLPLVDRGLSVVIIKDDFVKVAFTHGLIRPKIFISTGLLASLDRDELRSVLLHEIHHRKNRDPLRFFIASFLKDAFFYLPVSGYLAGRVHDMGEMAADDSVLERTGDPLGLAETLVKVASLGSTNELRAARAVSIRGYGSIEGRIIRLVEGGDAGVQRPGARVLISSALIAAAVILSVSLPLSASAYDPGTCDMGHCSTHVSDMGDNCKVHCAVMD